MFGAGDMASTSQLIMGGQRINMDTDMDGNVFMNRDSSENLKRGYNESIGTSGVPEQVAGVAGEVLKYTGGGLLAAETAYKTYGPEGNKGIIKPAFKNTVNGLSSLAGWKEPFPKMEKDSIESSSENDKKETKDSTSDIKHKNSFESKSEGSVPKTDKSSNSITGEYKTVGRKLDKEGTGTQRTEERKPLTVTGIKSLFIDLAT